MTTDCADYVSRHLHVTMKSGSEWMARCIFHDDSNASLQINVEKGLFVCFACHAKGNMKTLERKLGAKFREEGIDVADIRAKLDLLREPPEREKVYPESYLDRYNFSCTYWSNERGFRKEIIEAFDLGYDPLGDSIGAYVTIPVRDRWGNLLGVVKRYLEDVELKYRYPKGFKRASHLFGSWFVEEDDECDHVVLTEGPLDAISVWEAGTPALACFGNSISTAQAKLLRRLGVTTVTIFGDNDRGGQDFTSRCRGWWPHRNPRGRAVQWTYKPETDLTRHFLVRVVDWKGSQGKDPNAVDVRQRRLMLRNARSLI